MDWAGCLCTEPAGSHLLPHARFAHVGICHGRWTAICKGSMQVNRLLHEHVFARGCWAGSQPGIAISADKEVLGRSSQSVGCSASLLSHSG